MLPEPRPEWSGSSRVKVRTSTTRRGAGGPEILPTRPRAVLQGARLGGVTSSFLWFLGSPSPSPQGNRSSKASWHLR